MDPDKPDDVEFVSRLIDEVRGMVCIDKKRIYAAGFSGGGRMASRLGCSLSDRIAASLPWRESDIRRHANPGRFR
ncbi:MAG: hypothetical protein GY859_30695 [Desulfobacterales bacterium]|nr:hypothetical protein [Desulfobacterales bacterium]